MSQQLQASIGGNSSQVAASPGVLPSSTPADAIYTQLTKQGIDPNDIQLTSSTDNPSIVHAHITVRGKDTDGVEKQTTIVLRIPLEIKNGKESSRIAAFEKAGRIAIATHQTAMGILNGSINHKFLGNRKGGHADVVAFFAKGTSLKLDMTKSGDVTLQAARFNTAGSGSYTAVEGSGAVVMQAAKSANFARFALSLTRDLHGQKSVTGNTELEDALEETLKGMDSPAAAEAKASARAMRERCASIIEANNDKIKELKAQLDATQKTGQVSANTQRILDAILQISEKNDHLHSLAFDIIQYAEEFVRAERDLAVTKSLPHAQANVRTAEQNLETARSNYHIALARYEHVATGEDTPQKEKGVSNVGEFFSYLRGAVSKRARGSAREALIASRQRKDPERLHLQDPTLDAMRSVNRESVLKHLEPTDHASSQLDASLALAGKPQAFMDRLEATQEDLKTLQDDLIRLQRAAIHLSALHDPLPKIGESLTENGSSNENFQRQNMRSFIQAMIPGSLAGSNPKLQATDLKEAFKELRRLANLLSINAENEPACQALLQLAEDMSNASNATDMEKILNGFTGADIQTSAKAFEEVCEHRVRGLNEVVREVRDLKTSLADLTDSGAEAQIAACCDRLIGSGQLVHPERAERDKNTDYSKQVLARALLSSTLGSASRILRGQVNLGGVKLDITPLPPLESARRTLYASLGLNPNPHESELKAKLSALVEDLNLQPDVAVELYASLSSNDPVKLQHIFDLLLPESGKSLHDSISDRIVRELAVLNHDKTNLEATLASEGSPEGGRIATQIAQKQSKIDALQNKLAGLGGAHFARIQLQVNGLFAIREKARDQLDLYIEELHEKTGAFYTTFAYGSSADGEPERSVVQAFGELASAHDTEHGDDNLLFRTIAEGIRDSNPRAILGIPPATNREKTHERLTSHLSALLESDHDAASDSREKTEALLAIIEKANDILLKEEQALAAANRPIEIPKPPQRVAPPKPATPAAPPAAPAQASATPAPTPAASTPAPATVAAATSSRSSPATAPSPSTAAPVRPMAGSPAARPSFSGAPTLAAPSSSRAAPSASSSPAARPLFSGAPAPLAAGPAWHVTRPARLTRPIVPDLSNRGLHLLPSLQTNAPNGRSWGQIADQHLVRFQVKGQSSRPDTRAANSLVARLNGQTDVVMFYRYPETPDSALFGNFEPCPNGVTILLNGRQFMFQTAEAAFQAAKISYLQDQGQLSLQDATDLIDRLQVAATGHDAWSIGQSQSRSLRGAWHTDVKGKLMLQVVKAKFAQNPEFAAGLLSQEGKMLIENSGDVEGDWSVYSENGGGFQGRNLLGCALMQIMNDPDVIAAALESSVRPQEISPQCPKNGIFGRALREKQERASSSPATAATDGGFAAAAAAARRAQKPQAPRGEDAAFVVRERRFEPTVENLGGILNSTFPSRSPGNGWYQGPPSIKFKPTANGTPLSHTFASSGLRLEVKNANIFAIEADVIVNPAQRALGTYRGDIDATRDDAETGIGGLNRRMYERCGSAYRNAYNQLRSECCAGADHFPSGAAALVPSGREGRPEQKVMIVAGPNATGVREYNPAIMNALYRSYYNSLLLAAQTGATSLAFPSISTGIYQFNPSLAAEIATRAIEDFSNLPVDQRGNLTHITICASGEALQGYIHL